MKSGHRPRTRVSRAALLVGVLMIGVLVPSAPMRADATVSYAPLYCTSRSFSASSATFINLVLADTPRMCPGYWTIVQRTGYFPEWGFETNMSTAHGSVEVRTAGECGVIPDTGLTWDFQIPCKTHDLCYDLRKIGLSETVTDVGCDNNLKTLMDANCNPRPLPARVTCLNQSAIVATAVIPAMTSPDPPALLIKAKHSTKCLNVTNNVVGSPIVQGLCGQPNGVDIWRIMPVPGSAGKFRIKSSYSGMCISAPSNSSAFQYGCYDYTDQQFRVEIQSNGLYDSTFSLRPAIGNNTQCIDVPGASQADNVTIITYPCVSGATNEAFFL